jgi:four helix bundle protein
MTIRNYADLAAWQKAMDLAEAVYRVTAGFPKEELYGLRGQLRKAATSVPSNIAEGQGRRSDGAFAHHLSIAHGSLREVETQVLLAGRFGYLDQDQSKRLLEQAAEVGRLISGLANSLRTRSDTP